MNDRNGKVVIATGNPGKLVELQGLLGDLGMELVAQSEFGVESAEETGTTFAENALLKARHAAACTGLPAIADDSGIVVDALDGRPGVYSARYAGTNATDEENVDKLLAELAGISNRSAHFHCAAVYVPSDDASEPLVVEAGWHGIITGGRRGSGGFGYDPVFFLPEFGCTSAELSRERKNELSHRGQAFRELKRLLAADRR